MIGYSTWVVGTHIDDSLIATLSSHPSIVQFPLVYEAILGSPLPEDEMVDFTTGTVYVAKASQISLDPITTFNEQFDVQEGLENPTVYVPTGGTTNQVLRKRSNTNFDLEWGTVGGTQNLIIFSQVYEIASGLDLEIEADAYFEIT